MIQGIFWALLAGLLLGLYALPAKYTKDYQFENTWGLFFLLTMFVIPCIAAFAFVKDLGETFSMVPVSTIIATMLMSFSWGCGVMLWGKAITHIGLALGFALFIGTVTLVGSVIPLFIRHAPPGFALLLILAGICTVLLGILANGRAGLIREKDEVAASLRPGDREQRKARVGPYGGSSMGKGIFIAILGGVLASGFNISVTIGQRIQIVSTHLGNPAWAAQIAIMLPIFLGGGIAVTVYFLVMLTKKQAWRNFGSPHFFVNLGLIAIMALFHYTASAIYALAAFHLGNIGTVVGYPIFSAGSTIVAVVAGVLTGEWAKASARARRWLYAGLLLMTMGVIVLSVGRGMVG